MRVLTGAIALAFVLLGMSAACAMAVDVTAPHVVQDENTDTCAMCHRSHTSASGVFGLGALDTTMNALIVGTSTGEAGDTQLCYSCHGYESLGSLSDVQTDFEKRSYHRVAPETSAFGPGLKQCSSCHDSHGSSRTASGTPYPALLSVMDASGDPVTTGDAYCTTCHDRHIVGGWSGTSIWRQTAHADLAPTASGTAIVCSVCHQPHGSDNTALIAERLLPPSVEDTVAVPANDRWLCYGCHAASLVTYGGGLTFEGSTHGSTSTSVAVDAEWASRYPAGSAETRRPAGECQNCHAATGRDDGAGAPIASLLDAKEEALCYRCHGVGSATAADIESLNQAPTPSILEVVATYRAAGAGRQFGVTQVYTRESTASAALTAPRQSVDSSVGPMATADIDGDGKPEVLVSRAGTSKLAVLTRSALSGLSADSRTLLAEPDFIAVGDVLSDVAGLNEIITADGPYIRAYRWSLSGLDPVGTYAAASNVTGLTVGDVLGTDSDDVVATIGTSSADGELIVIDGATGLLERVRSYSTAPGLPAGPSVGDLDGAGKEEIAVAIGSNETTNILRLYDATQASLPGALIAQGGTTTAGQTARQALIGDVLWGAAEGGRQAEISVVFADANDGARVDVFPQTATGEVGTPEQHTLPVNSNPGQMAAGDIDGDAHPELVVALGGSFTDKQLAGLRVLQPNADGTGIASEDVYSAGGNQIADAAPGHAWVSIVQLGSLGLSRHAVEGVSGSHVSTESADFARHVECADCHNVHEATSTAGVAPAAYGAIRGVWGVSVENAPVGEITYQQQPGILNEYELCLKCHGRWSSPFGETRDIASEVDTRNASVHAVEGTSTTSEVMDGTFVVGSNLTNESVLYCASCHGNAGSGPKGPHASRQAPILVAPYYGVTSGDADALCFDCHRRDVYYTGTADVPTAGSRFWKSSKPLLHTLHAEERGIACGACHTSHGSSVPHLLRVDIGFEAAGTGGSCENGCHARLGYEGR